MFKKLISTNDSDYAAMLVRLALGFTMLPHGLQKLGYLGGGGIEGTMSFLSGMLHVPSFVVWLVIIAETVGAIALIAGFLARFCAAALAIDMIGAVLLVHLPKGFFAGNGGYELNMLLIGTGLAIIISGAGAWSIDAMLQKKVR